MRAVRCELDPGLRQAAAHEVDRVGAEVDERERLVLVVVLRRRRRVERADERLDRLALAVLARALAREGALDARGAVVLGAVADRDRDDALEALERHAVELVAAEEVEQDRLELLERRVRVPQVGERLGGGEVEQRDRAGGRLDALRRATE